MDNGAAADAAAVDRTTENSMTSIDLGSQSAAWDASDVDWSAPPTAMSPSGEASSSGRLSGGGASINDRPSLSIVSTSNAIESGEMVRRFVVQLEVGDRRWEITRRYSDFFELERRLAAAFGSAAMPEFPPRLLRNSDDDIADRMVQLDAWLRALTPPMLEHRWVRTFLGLPLLPSVNASSLYIYHSSPGRSI